MKIVFMGTPELAAVVLRSLIDAGHEVVQVVTQPDKPKGRSGAAVYPPVKELALERRIPVCQPVKVRNDEAFIEQLKKIAPDVIAVAAFGQILPKSVLAIPKYGCINVHTSLLPKYRGSAPIQQAIIDGAEVTGVTIMYMAEGIDTGDIIMSREVALDKKETVGSLTQKLAEAGGGLLVEALRAVEDGTAQRIPQDESLASYYGVLNKTMGEMDFTLSAERLECLVRGLNPWPSAYTRLSGKILKIWESDVPDEKQAAEAGLLKAVPGVVAGTDKNAIYVGTGDGFLALTEIQLEGKKRMKAGEFLKGCRIAAGTKLG